MMKIRFSDYQNHARLNKEPVILFYERRPSNMKDTLYFLLSMVIFGAVGIFAKYISLDSCQIAFFLSLIGALCLLFSFARKKTARILPSVRKNMFLLLAASIALSGNWIFLFRAYKNTTIANAALSYYLAPVLVILVSPLILQEKFSLKKLLCTGAALSGLFLILQNGLTADTHDSATGMLYGLGAAFFYAALTIINKFIKDLDGLTNTFFQLLLAAILLAGYSLTAGNGLYVPDSAKDIVLLLLLGICHGGIGFYLFFTSLPSLDGQSIAVLSYADPLTSLLVSVLCLGEAMNLQQCIGAFILFSSIWLAEKTPVSHRHTSISAETLSDREPDVSPQRYCK